VHVACPQCGTGYRLEANALERERLRLRCRRCRQVWDPSRPLATPTAAPVAAEVIPADVLAEPGDGDEPARPTRGGGEPDAGGAIPAELAAAGASRPPQRRAAALLYAFAAVLMLASGAGFGWAYRDAVPFLAAPLPEFTEVRPAWRGDAQARRLTLSAQVANPGDAATEIRRVRVKFLSRQGAWIDETVVEVPGVTVPAGGTGRLEIAVDRLPEGTASLELSVVPNIPAS
jgi:predicted Zn finger-like uncharacterized protein